MLLINVWRTKRAKTEQHNTKSANEISRIKEIMAVYIQTLLKVKCNEIWTIFLLSKNLCRNVICNNIKKNQLFEISFVRTVALKTRKSDDFRELHENEPEMAALGVETNYRYL